MRLGDLIEATEACQLLNISRPTFKKYREQYNIAEFQIRRKIKFSKLEVLQKIYTSQTPLAEKFSFAILSHNPFDTLKVDDSTYDLRRIDDIDGHGAISLVCHLMSEIRKKDKYIHLIIDESLTYLRAMNFFGVLLQHHNSKIFWDESEFQKIPDYKYGNMIKLPITRLGVVGSHSKITDDLTLNLQQQGYSQDVCAYVGWAIGELADNSVTHAKVHPCFVYCEQFGADKRFLQFTIGDIGVGIPVSLKKNPKHEMLSNAQALLTSFKPNISGRDDSEERGKGLTDVLKIAMECGSNLKVESNGLGFFLKFFAGLDNFEIHQPLYQNEGTMISILFIDGNFASLDRSDVSKYINICLEKI